MEFERQLIPDIFLIKPKIFSDKRGYFTETFRQDLLELELGYKINFIQENESKSSKGVLRGLHYQIPPFSQSKLVRVIEGRVLDVAVDIRTDSSTFGQHVALELSDSNKYQVFIPHGFAHGFIVLSDFAVFNYKVDNFYSPDHDYGIAFNDKNLGIDWQLDSNQLILSVKDKEHPFLSDSIELFK
jgi:dTDP-4-dehydrorhamnose 3,5-epimerase